MNSFSWSHSYSFDAVYIFSLSISFFLARLFSVSTQSLIDLFSIIWCTLFDSIQSMVFLFHKSFAACAHESFIIFNSECYFYRWTFFFFCLNSELNVERNKALFFTYNNLVFLFCFMLCKSTSTGWAT